MFEKVEPAAPDAILGLNEAFQADSNPNKINLSVGQFKDAEGKTPILGCVKQAEEELLKSESSKGYLGIVGDTNYGKMVPGLLFGADNKLLSQNRVATVQSPGGTGALRIVADFIATNFPGSTVWLSEPTWPNHPNIFKAAGVPTKSYAYYDESDFSLNYDAMVSDLAKVPAGDFVMLHGCCHNPTGVDIADDQWNAVGEILKKGNVTPIVDFAYQGFGSGIEEDAIGVRTLAEHVDEMIVCSSFSKNFGLYCERIGAVTTVAADADASAAVISRLKKCIRANYSNPPAHGAKIVAKVLGDEALTKQWHAELAEMRNRILDLRKQIAATMKSLGSPVDFEFITEQRGMFSFTGLTREQVQKLRDEHSLYIVGNGRINVAGLKDDQIEIACKAIIDVL